MPGWSTTRADVMAGQILRIVKDDGLDPGIRLIEQDLADRLGVSRGPVRAGLKALATAGLVQGAKNRGYVLAKSPTSPKALQKIATRSPATRAYVRLSEDLLDGVVGRVVTEAEIARRYDLGRAEALRLLERIATEGWIAKLPGYGWRFSETLIDPDGHAKAAEFRALIEPAALLTPGYALRSDALNSLRARQLQVREIGVDAFDRAEIFRSGCDFHEALVGASDNPFHLDALKRVNAIRRLFAYRSYLDRKGLRRHIDQHLALLDLLEQGRVSAAAELLRHHLSKPLRLYRKPEPLVP